MAETLTATPSIRVLPPEEWERLRWLPDFLGVLPDPTYWRIIVAEIGGPGGEIVAYNCLYETVHAEPLWIAEEYRHHAKLFVGLWQTTKQVLTDLQINLVHVTVSDDLPLQQRLVEKFGFQRAPGRLYLLDVAQAIIRDKD